MGFLCPLVTFFKVPLRQLFATDLIGTFSLWGQSLYEVAFIFVSFVSNFEPTYIYLYIYKLLASKYLFLQKKKIYILRKDFYPTKL